MRALLPVTDSRSRSLIHTYIGSAPTIDARTICVRPNITHVQIRGDENEALIVGNISVPIDLQSSLLASISFEAFSLALFTCELSEGIRKDYKYGRWHHSNDEFYRNARATSRGWDLTICDLDFARPGMRSEFGYTGVSIFDRPSAFLLINYTGYRGYNDSRTNSPLELANINQTTSGARFQQENQWLELKPKVNDLGTLSNANMDIADTRLSFTLCFPFFDGFLLNISTASQAPLQEPDRLYDAKQHEIHYDHGRKQLLRSSGQPMEERGLLSLHRQSWLVPC